MIRPEEYTVTYKLYSHIYFVFVYCLLSCVIHDVLLDYVIKAKTQTVNAQF
jgi:hypothetical protein